MNSHTRPRPSTVGIGANSASMVVAVVFASRDPDCCAAALGEPCAPHLTVRAILAPAAPVPAPPPRPPRFSAVCPDCPSAPCGEPAEPRPRPRSRIRASHCARSSGDMLFMRSSNCLRRASRSSGVMLPRRPSPCAPSRGAPSRCAPSPDGRSPPRSPPPWAAGCCSPPRRACWPLCGDRPGAGAGRLGCLLARPCARRRRRGGLRRS